MSPKVILPATESTDDNKGALQLLTDTRSKLREHVGLNTDGEEPSIGMEHCIAEIQAPIVVNDEIFKRCMVNSRAESGDKTTVERYGFETIELRVISNMFEVVTQAEHTHQIFGTSFLSKLPSCLADTLLVKYKGAPYSSYIDYADYFKKAMMLLHEDALRMLLPKLKDHLESVQVCLGEIDEFAMKPHKIMSIVNQFPGTKFRIPNICPNTFQCQVCFSCDAAIDSGSSTKQKCGKLRVLKTIENKPVDTSNESDHERLLKIIDAISGN